SKYASMTAIFTNHISLEQLELYLFQFSARTEKYKSVSVFIGTILFCGFTFILKSFRSLRSVCFLSWGCLRSRLVSEKLPLMAFV
ncbi:hypothetical protein PMAYCL1PPCAC_16413, partial [Pristionchus mayeri]